MIKEEIDYIRSATLVVWGLSDEEEEDEEEEKFKSVFF
jgi:hypothetical protein